jgi:hypothetical protein
MGTRGIIGFQINNEIKATYNHSASDPACLGVEAALFLHHLGNNEIAFLQERVKNIRWVSEEETPSTADIKKFKRFADISVGSRSLKDWYCLLRNVQGIEALPYIMQGTLDVLIDSTEFLKCKDYCEWGYVLNFDNNTLDVYTGWHEEKSNACQQVYSISFQSLRGYGTDNIQIIMDKLEDTYRYITNKW